MCKSLNFAVNKCINLRFLHLYLLWGVGASALDLVLEVGALALALRVGALVYITGY